MIRAFLVLGLFSFFQMATGQLEYSGLFIPEELRDGADAVVRSSEVTFKVISENRAVRSVNETITILNPHGDKYSKFSVIYDNFRSLLGFKGTVYDAQGNVIRKVKRTDLKDESYSTNSLFLDYRIIFYDPTIKSYPYTVSYQYDMYHSSLFFPPFWHVQPDYGVAVQHAVFKTIVPVAHEVRFREMNIVHPVDTAMEKSNMIFTWRVDNLPAIEDEPFSPFIDELAPAVYSSPTAFKLGGTKGNMGSWEGFGQWIRSLNEGRRELPESTIAEMRAMASACMDTLEVIQKVYRYLQDNTRYVSIQLGIGGWQPVEAAKVDELGYGDCKALSNYMISLLDAVGIKAGYSLVRAGNNMNRIDKDFPSQQFNHVIVCVPLHKDTVWLECTDQHVAFGYLGNFTSDRYCLVISDDTVEMIKTPSYPKEVNTQKRVARVTIDAYGDGMATVSTTYSGLQYDLVSDVILSGPEEQKKWIYADKDIPAFEVHDFSFTQLPSTIPSITENLVLKLVNYASRSGNRLFLPVNLMNRMNKVPNTRNVRKRDIVMRFPFLDTDTVYYIIPADFEIEYVPEATEVGTEFGHYSSTIKVTGDTILFSRHLDVNKGRYPAEKYPELIGFFNVIVKADKEKIILKEIPE